MAGVFKCRSGHEGLCLHCAMRSPLRKERYWAWRRCHGVARFSATGSSSTSQLS
jgi:hypothetical protein